MWYWMLIIPFILTAAQLPTYTNSLEEWHCPEITEQPVVECSCDFPHTLRCTGNRGAMPIIARKLRSLDGTAAVSLLDCTVQNVSALSGPLLDGVALHGLVVSSGEIKNIHRMAFSHLAGPLQALGLPNNQLEEVPIDALNTLKSLDRLDLSHNRLKRINYMSFKGLHNLSFLELSNNILSEIHPETFSLLSQLRVLRLRGNKINVTTISRLNPFPTLQELDLSSNNLVGPLGQNTFPYMRAMQDLQLSHNSFSSVRKGALKGFKRITVLSLHHNQIDVIEDNAFIHLSRLAHLDLSHNRIVAVSGASLAHLSNLTELDLRHNFLRALTPDLIIPLSSLKELRLDDNDISIIASDALKRYTYLRRLTLSDNPLNCDCSLIEFSLWLSNSTLSLEDRSTAVCATPPSLENGLLFQIPSSDLLCEEDEQEALMAPAPEPVAKRQIILEDFQYDGDRISLQWKVDPKSIPYSCDAIFVYEEEDDSEVLIESNPLKCNSSAMVDPNVLKVDVPDDLDLQPGHRYRYCVVLLEMGHHTDELSLVLGCSDVLPLITNIYVKPKKERTLPPRITFVRANLTSYGSLLLEIGVWPKKTCYLNTIIFKDDVMLLQKRVNCSESRHIFAGLQDEGPYKVCVSIAGEMSTADPTQRPRCILVFRKEPKGLSGLDVILISLFLMLSFAMIALIWGIRKLVVKPKVQTQQCFISRERTEHQHPHYVKLHATTKL